MDVALITSEEYLVGAEKLVSKSSKPFTRRLFVRLALAGTVTALVEAACQDSPGSAPTATVASPTAQSTATARQVLSPTPAIITTAIPEAVAAATPTPLPTPEIIPTFPPLSRNTPELLASHNDRHYNVRYYKPFAPVDRDAWRLKVSGLIAARANFRLADLLAWPQIQQVSRLKCVECWSFRAKWGGFHYSTLVEHVELKPEATHVRFDCADDYWETVSVEELADPRVIFVLRMNDDVLRDEYGAPLRMIFPAKYGYKSAKAITSITFTDRDGAGYWSTVGPYPGHGDIQPGVDSPQDMPGQSMVIDGGEITTY
jgi:DMSO/TMAO reductase YedYZ molybdopterin-dependent catalytic subunit